MNWYKKAKLIDKRHPDEPSEVTVKCMYCHRWATHPEKDNVEKADYVWKKDENLTPEERPLAIKSLMESNVSSAICPFCWNILREHNNVIDPKQIGQISLQRHASKASKEFSYFGQCNKVRCDNIGEDNWQNMIKNHQKVSPDEFINNCSIEELLESGETLQEMISDDPSSYFAKSWWGDKPCYYLMTKGFEFIFLPHGEQQNKQAAKQKYHKNIPKANQRGDCYHAAGTYLMDNAHDNPNLILVHGEVSGQGAIAGIRYGHAWIEDGDMIIDNSNGRNLHIPKMIYYSIGNIDPNKTFRYNMEQMRRKILDSGHWGPWDLKTYV